ncbi:MAG TPA: hypothetical protein PLU10_03955 [Chitinophagaceae bacterium]|nr:hypothetical protein [Chitinophagaceae bacterium]
MFKFMLLVFGFVVSAFVTEAQSADDQELNTSVRTYNEKINELQTLHTKNGFGVYKEQRIPLQSGIEHVILLKLVAGSWYHFSYVGDPNSDKINATLFKEGIGDLVQARIQVAQQKEFWVEFSFICPQSGIYELTLRQKCPISRPLSYLTVFQKLAPVATNNNAQSE